MDKPSSYCSYVNDPVWEADPLHRQYHDRLYGFPVKDDRELFGRLILEINQAGLNWLTILRKEENFRKAYDQFDPEKIARYGAKDKKRLLADPGIIRNRLKVEAAIHNAGIILQMQKEYGSFRDWLNHHHPLSREEWTKLFRRHFRFTGGEIVHEFLLSTGYLPGAHRSDCPVHAKILKSRPAWMQKHP